MTNTIRIKRKHTAAELGKRLDRTPRTIRRIISEPRDDYLLRAQQKRKEVEKLRKQGLTIRAISKKTGYSVGTVHRYAKEITQKN